MIHEKVLEKFGYPGALIKEYDYWYWLLRPEQITLGSSILITKECYFNYSDLTREHFLEFGKIVKEIEKTLGNTFNFDKMNYLMLMMVDPSVHYHVIPRYENIRILNDKEYIDNGFPGIPNFTFVNKTNIEEFNNIKINLINSL
jgi:diadenosine tetraphosphate (Ap4A) HIT family hydrolase